MDFQKHVFTRKTIDMAETGWNLRQIREARNLSVCEVARYLSTTQQSVYNWESGTPPKIWHLVSLCYLYIISLKDVIILKDQQAEYCDYDE